MITIEISIRQPRANTPKAFLWLLPPFVIAALALARVQPYGPDIAVPAQVMDPQHVVWADVNSGTLYYFKNRYAAKLHHTDPSMQDALVDLVRQTHRTQYFVVDSLDAQQACDRQAERYGASYAGALSARPNASVWKLGDGGDGVRSCVVRP